MRSVLSVVILTGVLVMAGCARHKQPAAKTAGSPAANTSTNSALIVTPGEGLNGKVSWVNSNLRFVVITFPLGQMPTVDRRLNVYRRGLKVAEVKISGPQTEDSIVADVETGEVQAGDTVSDR